MSLLFCLCVCSILRVTCPCCFVCVCVQYLGSHVLVVLFVCVFVLRVTCPCCFVCVCVCAVLRVTCPWCFVCVCVQYLGSHVLVVLFVCVFSPYGHMSLLFCLCVFFDSFFALFLCFCLVLFLIS